MILDGGIDGGLNGGLPFSSTFSTPPHRPSILIGANISSFIIHPFMIAFSFFTTIERQEQPPTFFTGSISQFQVGLATSAIDTSLKPKLRLPLAYGVLLLCLDLRLVAVSISCVRLRSD
ncbi:hypothetical protein BO82DRAFT_120547 [Aspergillus uvarum CBS 121591]|uniref:Uncharacterized protein n=1 Tax=Aspergillus uvarum CBS 121591 TaxID=1448315 RepID=A0A319C857_9EURO|nr:hypothetical protein BO82DRAFT_120547 [Aspergillus uvarum CBS 121591]PYH80079.1 hypothetical protein BO82DRAFT_120547 [Aspergillus uvarum CBS 121591]